MINKFKITTFALVVFTLCLFLVSFTSAAETKTLTVGAFKEETLIFNLNDGYKISGSLSISGGLEDDIKFWITDPEGTTILDLGKVMKGRSFEFTALKNGAFTLHFDNSYSWIHSKTVTLTYDIDVGSVITSNPLVWVALGISAILLIGGGFFLYHKRTKNSLPATSTPPPT